MLDELLCRLLGHDPEPAGPGPAIHGGVGAIPHVCRRCKRSVYQQADEWFTRAELQKR